MKVFHQNGFADTSLAQLEAGSGLNRRQIYNDFGDKREVFLQVIQDFIHLSGKEILVILEHSEEGIDAIEKTLNTFVKMADSPQGRFGCLVCNTTRDPIANDPEVSQIISQFFRRIEGGYRDALERAAAAGELAPDENLRSLARFLLGVHVSLCVMSRGGESVAVLRDIKNEAIQRLR